MVDLTKNDANEAVIKQVNVARESDAFAIFSVHVKDGRVHLGTTTFQFPTAVHFDVLYLIGQKLKELSMSAAQTKPAPLPKANLNGGLNGSSHPALERIPLSADKPKPNEQDTMNS